MKRWVLVLVGLMCLLAAGAVFAQVEEEEQVIYEKTTILPPFDTVNLVGNMVGPVNSFMPVKKGAHFKLLIPVRDNFLPEMMKTVSSL